MRRQFGLQLQGFLPTGLVVEQDTGLLAAERVLDWLRTGNQFLYGAAFDLSEPLAGWLTAAVASSSGKPRKRTLRTVDAVVTATARLSRESRRALANELDALLTDNSELAGSGSTTLSVVPLPSYLDAAADALLEQLAAISYLGPLREEPRATYELPPAGRPVGVGLKGQYTAAVLNDYREHPVVYRHPDSGETERQTLRRAVDFWLGRLKLIESARSTAAGRLGHQLLFMAEGLTRPVDPTFVGVGVSQALPVIVQGLLAPPNSVLLLEQPELHLHPDVQADLADFLLALAASGRQIVHETHSEHLINRLRLRVAEVDRPAKPAIYFVARDARNGTQFEHLDLTDAGAFRTWPRGFLDRASKDAEALLRANLREGRA